MKEIVERQLNRSGNTLLMAVQPLTEEIFFAAGASGISPAWTVGHLACVADLFTSWLVPRPVALPLAVHAVFNPLEVGPPPATTKAELVDRGQFPRGELVLLFRRAQIAALESLEGFDIQRWDAQPPGPAPDNLPTCGAIWEHLAIHTYWHLGELAGSIGTFHGTYTLNMVPHYFFFRGPKKSA